MTAINREIRLRSRPIGLPGEAHFEIVEAPVPCAGAGELLVRNRWFRISASVRMMISQGAEAVEGVPFPALREGDVLAEEAIGEVVTAPPGSGFAPGDVVRHFKGWRDYALVRPDEVRQVDRGFSDPAVVLGHGWTAYAALTRAATIAPGDTVFVSSAGGAIGCMAGQIARNLGAGLVIGSTSSAAKGKRLVEELGYDIAICREAGPIEAQLRAAAPHGIDVTLDSVGGEQLAAAVKASASGGRIVVIGALSGQLASKGAGRTAPVTLDSFQLLVKKLSLRGYSADDHPDAETEWHQKSKDWSLKGVLDFPKTIVSGLENAPRALARFAAGDHFGVVLVRV